MALFGLVNNLLGTSRLSRRDLDPGNQVQQRYRQLSDPQYGLSQFRQMAADAAPSADTFLSATQAVGGSQAQAHEQLQAAQQRSRAQAYGQFQQFRLGADQQANQVLGMQQRQNRLLAQDQWRRDATAGGFLNSVLGMGSTILGSHMGG